MFLILQLTTIHAFYILNLEKEKIVENLLNIFFFKKIVDFVYVHTLASKKLIFFFKEKGDLENIVF